MVGEKRDGRQKGVKRGLTRKKLGEAGLLFGIQICWIGYEMGCSRQLSLFSHSPRAMLHLMKVPPVVRMSAISFAAALVLVAAIRPLAAILPELVILA